MKHVKYPDKYTQEELMNYFSIANPCKCEKCGQIAKVIYKDGLYELEQPCCEELKIRIRQQICKLMSNRTNKK